MSPCSYEVMRSCWDEDPVSRPSFSELLQMLKDLLAELPELEASQEVNYMNQVLQVSAATATSQNMPQPGRDRHENTYSAVSNDHSCRFSRGGDYGYMKCWWRSSTKTGCFQWINWLKDSAGVLVYCYIITVSQHIDNTNFIVWLNVFFIFL